MQVVNNYLREGEKKGEKKAADSPQKRWKVRRELKQTLDAWKGNEVLWGCICLISFEKLGSLAKAAADTQILSLSIQVNNVCHRILPLKYCFAKPCQCLLQFAKIDAKEKAKLCDCATVLKWPEARALFLSRYST